MLSISNAGGPLLVVAGVVAVATMTVAKPRPDEVPERTEQLAGPRSLAVAVALGLLVAVAVLVTIGTVVAL